MSTSACHMDHLDLDTATVMQYSIAPVCSVLCCMWCKSRTNGHLCVLCCVPLAAESSESQSELSALRK